MDYSSAKLKLDLFCQGARVHKNCRLAMDTRPVKRTRGGLGSGLDAILPGEVWVNIPIEEPFAKQSPFVIEKVAGHYSLWRGDAFVCKIKLPPRPDWYNLKASSGKLIGDIGVMQGTYFAVYPSDLCGFWKRDPQQNCGFCSVGLCLGKTESEEKTVKDVVEAVQAARRNENVTFVHFNTGFYEDDGAIDAVLPYVQAVKCETGLLVGVQCPPAKDLSKYDALKAAGVDHIAFCFELFDPERFQEVCPGKAEAFGLVAESLDGDELLAEAKSIAKGHLGGKEPHPGQLVFYRALLYSVKLWGKGRVAGEIIAGLESPGSSIAGIEFLGECGAVSTVCVFRPCVGTDLEELPPPSAQETAPIFSRIYEVVVQNRIPIGVAPNIKTAMVHLPGEGKGVLAGARSVSDLWHRATCLLLKGLFRARMAMLGG